RPSACSPPSPPSWPTTASRTPSTASPTAWKPLWKSSPTSCNATWAPAPRPAPPPTEDPHTMAKLAGRGRGRRTMNEINMVPFIDVMLVLLIIFMVTAPLITPSQISLPSVGQAQRQPERFVQVIIDKDEQLRV